MGFIGKLFGDDEKRFYNRKAFAVANETLKKFKVGDYIVYRSWDEGILVQNELYKVLNIVLGECKGDNHILQMPQFYVENVIDGRKFDLIVFYPYTTKTGTPAPYRDARIQIGYPKGPYKEITLADNIEIKQMLEGEMARRAAEKRRQEEAMQARKARDIENAKISDSEINNMVNALRKGN